MAAHLANFCANDLQVGEKNSTHLARCEATEVGAQLLGCNDADATASVRIVVVQDNPLRLWLPPGLAAGVMEMVSDADCTWVVGCRHCWRWRY